jgi:hypothetical protein
MFFVILQNPFSLRGLRIKNLADLVNSRCDFLSFSFFFFFFFKGLHSLISYVSYFNHLKMIGKFCLIS